MAAGCFPDVSKKPAKFHRFIVRNAQIPFCVCHVISRKQQYLNQDFTLPYSVPGRATVCFLVCVSLMLVPERTERKRWGKSLLNLLLKTKVSSCLLYWSTGTNRNSGPLRVFKWGFLGLRHICFLLGRSEGLKKVSNSRSVSSMLQV